MDPGFLNDTTIYYNLPPLLATKDNNRRSTLPRPHSSFICERSSSCPTSPRLSIFRPKCKFPQTQQTIASSQWTRGDIPNTSIQNGETIERQKRNDHSKPASEISEQVPLYQNTGNVNTKSRRKPLFFPWWKRKRLQAEIEVGSQVQTEESNVPESKEKGEAFPSEIKLPPHQDSVETFPLPSNYLALRTRSSSCSSSTTLNEDDDDDKSEGVGYGEEVLVGISYVKPSKTSSVAAELSQKSATKVTADHARGNIDFSHKIAHWVREWGRKSRWLSRRRREKNPRHNGEGDVDIALVYFGKDTAMWADYLHDNFTFLLQDKLGRPQVRIEKIDIENFSGYHEIPEVQASRLNDAKLQMVILSPGFLAFLHSESEFQIGKLLRPKRVLTLLLGVTQQTVKSNSVALSALYSFEEWAWLQVRDRDETFVSQVQEESLRLLTHCDVFDQCKASSAFSVCPRKITQSYCKVYIHLKSPLYNVYERQIHVTVGHSSSSNTPIPHVQYHNPFTLSFDMPEKLLGVSSFLKVNLHVDGSFIGCREVKCEGPLEILKELLKSAADPTALMCQALGISPVSNELDEILAQRVKGKLPFSRDFDEQHKRDCVPVTHELPTWLHFSAFFGLQNFTWALLDVPGGERALLIKNSKGHTPAKLALRAGYTKLAQDLENVCIVTALARKACANKEPHCYSSDTCLEGYSPVPRPRPYTPRIHSYLPNYDTPPQPRSVKEFQSSTPINSKDISSSTDNSNETLYANLQLDSSPLVSSGNDSRKSPPVSEDTSGDQEYLDMSGMSLQFEEYQKDISILVDAWDKRNDAKTFLSEYQHTISKLKENFHFKTQNSDDSSPCPFYRTNVESNEGTNEDSSTGSEDN